MSRIVLKKDPKTLRNYWNSDKFLRECFGNSFNRTNIRVKNFLNTLNDLPLSNKFTVVAYGSLLNVDDVPRTMPTAENIRKGDILGYERIFNIGSLSTGSFLNIRKTYQNNYLTCSFIDIDATDMPEYILREGLYNLVLLKDEEIDSKSEYPVITVIGKDQYTKTSIGVEPQLNYVHLCVSGIIDLCGYRGAEHFIEESVCYSRHRGMYVYLSQWLEDLNLRNYLLSYTYSSR